MMFLDLFDMSILILYINYTIRQSIIMTDHRCNPTINLEYNGTMFDIDTFQTYMNGYWKISLVENVRGVEGIAYSIQRVSENLWFHPCIPHQNENNRCMTTYAFWSSNPGRCGDVSLYNYYT